MTYESHPEQSIRWALHDYFGEPEQEEKILRLFAARVWREGFDAGETDFLEHLGSSFDKPCITNPYDDGEIAA